MRVTLGLAVLAATVGGTGATLRAPEDEARDKRAVRLAETLRGKDAAARATAMLDLRKMGPAGKAAAPVLVAALKDADAEVRLLAANALLAVDPAQAPAALAAVAAVHDKGPAGPAFFFLVAGLEELRARDKDTVAALLVLARHKEQGAALLGRIGLNSLAPEARDAAPLLRDALKDERPGVRLGAASGLARLGRDFSAPAVPVLVDLLKDDEYRSEAAHALADADPAAAAKAAAGLLPGLKADDRAKRLETARLLLVLDAGQAPAVAPVIAQGLAEKDKRKRLAAAQDLAALGQEDFEVSRALVKAAQDKEADVAAAAAEALIRIRPSGALAVLPDLATARDRRDGTQVAEILKLVEVIEKIAEEQEEADRALRQIKEDEAAKKEGRPPKKIEKETARERIAGLVERLEKAPERRNGELVQLDAVARLAKLGPPAKGAAAALEKTLKTGQPLMRSQAAYALGQIGPDAKAATAALVALCKDRGQPRDLRRTALAALKKIDPEQAKGVEVP
jgi:HEAT repeat protein